MQITQKHFSRKNFQKKKIFFWSCQLNQNLLKSGNTVAQSHVLTSKYKTIKTVREWPYSTTTIKNQNLVKVSKALHNKIKLKSRIHAFNAAHRVSKNSMRRRQLAYYQ